jgi:hypothetical protein
VAINADTIKRNQASMSQLRSSWDGAWGEIARLVSPEMNHFYGGSMLGWARMAGYKAAEMHDPYAAQALEDGVSVFEGFVMPRGQRWQKLALDAELMKSIETQQWVEKVETRLFALRNDPESGFAGAVHESAMSLFAFGAQSMWVDIRHSPVTGAPLGLSYQSEFVGEIFVEWDAGGRPYRIHHQFTLTAEQALLKFKRDTPAKVREAMEGTNKEPNKEFEFIHVIEPNITYDPERIDHRGMPWSSCYYVANGIEQVFKEGGYRSLPRIFSTFTRGPRNGWGFSPTMRVLPYIRLLQEITRDRTFGAEMRLLPSYLGSDDELDGAILEMHPLGVTWGGLDERGNPKLKQIELNGDATDAERLAAEARMAIDKGYGRDLLQLNRELKTHITATRTAEEMAEKGVLLAPHARQESEWLAPQTQRELALLAEIGGMDDMPGEVAEYFAAEGGFHWRYDNQLSRLMKSADTASFLSLGEQVTLLAQQDKTYIEHFNREFPPEKVLAVLADNAGVPASMKATEKEKAAFDAEKQQRQQVEQLATVLPAFTDAIKNTAQAGAGFGAG